MALRLVQVAMNARDDAAVGRFWADALGWGISSEEPGVTNVEPAGLAYPDPSAVYIDVITVPEPKMVKNRVHVDLASTSAAHQAALVTRLRDLGATPADVGQGDVSWTVLADPEGNEFCVLAPWPGGRTALYPLSLAGACSSATGSAATYPGARYGLPRRNGIA